MNKKGFTLVEIILCIALLAIVGTGTTIAVVTIANKNETNILEENSKDFENALNIYLETHNEVLNNLYNNVEGAVVSLELLKNEGLIEDNLNIDYKKNYFVLSDAVLLSDGEEDECNGRVLIQTIKSWDLSKYDSSDVLYICPKGETSGSTILISDNYVIEQNKANLYNEIFVPKGENPNNWVKLDVEPENNNWIWFPNDAEKNLWRVLNVNENGEIKLIYNKTININQENNPYINKEKCLSTKPEYCKLTENIYGFDVNNNYFKFDDYTKFYSRDIFVSSTNTNGAAKYIIKNAIKDYEDILKFERYYPHASSPDMYDYAPGTMVELWWVKQIYEDYYEDYVGHVSFVEYRGTVNELGISYLSDQLVGISGSSELITSSKVAGGFADFGVHKDRKGNDYGIILYTSNYSPVITLKANVKFKLPTGCNNNEIGSKNCPYELLY